jgi:hypothetical protein
MKYFNTREELVEYIARNLSDFVISESEKIIKVVKFELFPTNCLMIRNYFIDLDKRNNKWKIRNVNSIDLNLKEIGKLAKIISPFDELAKIIVRSERSNRRTD